MLGPGEFFQGLALGGQQFFAGTIGMSKPEHAYLCIAAHMYTLFALSIIIV